MPGTQVQRRPARRVQAPPAAPPVGGDLEDPLVAPGKATEALGALLDPLTQLGGGTPGENVSNGIHQVVRDASGIGPDDADPQQDRLVMLDSSLATAVGVHGMANALVGSGQSDGERAVGFTKGALKTTQGVSATASNVTGSAQASEIATGVTGPLMALDALGALTRAGKSAEESDAGGVVSHLATGADRGARGVAAFAQAFGSESTQFADAVPMVEAAANLAQAPIRAKEAVERGVQAKKLGNLGKAHKDNIDQRKLALPSFDADHLDAVRGGFGAQQQFEAVPQHRELLVAKRLEGARKYGKQNKEISTALKANDAVGAALDGIGTFTAGGDMGITKAVGVGLKGVSEVSRLGQKVGDRAENVSAAVDADDLRKGYDRKGLLEETFDATGVEDTLGTGGQALNLATGGLAQGVYSGARGGWKAGKAAATSIYDKLKPGEIQHGKRGAIKSHALQSVGAGIVAGAGGLAAGAATGAAGLVGGTAKGLWSGAKLAGKGAKAAGQGIGKGLIAAGSAVGSVAAPVVGAAGDALNLTQTDAEPDRAEATYHFNGVEEALGEKGGMAVNALTGGLAQGATSAVSGGVGLAKKAGGATWDALKPDKLKDGDSKIVHGLKTAGAGTLAGLAGAGGAIAGATTGLIGGTAKGLMSTVKGAGKLVTGAGSAAMKGGKWLANKLTLGDAGSTYALDAVEDTGGKNVGGAANLITGGAAQGLTSAVAGAKNLGSAAGGAVWDALKPGEIQHGKRGAIKNHALQTVGAGLAAGVVGLGAGAVGGTIGAVTGLGKGVASGAKALGRGAKWLGENTVGRAASAVSESGAGAWFKDNIWHTRDGKDARKVGRFLTPEDSDEMLTRTKTSFDQDDQGGNAHIAALRQRAPGEALALQERLRGNRRGRAADDLTAAATSDTDAVNKDLASKQMKALGVAAADPKARDKLHAQFDW